MNAPRTFVFVGRSGCGKGTQATKLLEVLKVKDPTRLQLYIETGKNFRSFVEHPGFTSNLTKEFLNSGRRLPDFMAVWNWGRILVDQYTGEEHLVFDGVARSKPEAEMLATAAPFYNWVDPTIIHVAVSNEWSRARLLARGRGDDREEDIQRRLAWFDAEVVPGLEYFKTNPTFKFVEVFGERPIEVIHQDILKLTGLL
jgi:adenylate kinase